jgi:hypothetical protein
VRSSRSIGSAVLVVTSLALAACGSSSPSSNRAAKLDQMVAFAKCMRANGVPNFPDPGGNGNGGMVIQTRAGTPQNLTVNGVKVSSPAFQGAMQRCHSELPGGGTPPPLSASRRAAMLKFAQCMRANGLPSFPDPSFGPGGRIGLKVGPQGGLDPNSPAFRQAQAACAKYQGGGFRTQDKVP